MSSIAEQIKRSIVTSNPYLIPKKGFMDFIREFFETALGCHHPPNP